MSAVKTFLSTGYSQSTSMPSKPFCLRNVTVDAANSRRVTSEDVILLKWAALSFPRPAASRTFTDGFCFLMSFNLSYLAHTHNINDVAMMFVPKFR